MFELIVTLTSACLLLFVSAYAWAKGRDARSAALSFLTAVLAAAELLGYALLHMQTGPERLLRAATVAESLLPAAFAVSDDNAMAVAGIVSAPCRSSLPVACNA